MTTNLDNTVAIDLHRTDHALYMQALLLQHDEALLTLVAFTSMHGAEVVNRGRWHPNMTN